MRHVVAAVAAVVVVLTACGDQNGGSDPAEPSRAPPATTPEETPIDPNNPEAAAIADLAAHANVGEDEIEVVAHDEVTWRNGALGCPQPGMAYTQALVEGYRIVLRAKGQEYAYHGADGRPPFRCDDPDPDGAVDNPNI